MIKKNNICSKCGTENRFGSNYCRQCGSKLKYSISINPTTIIKFKKLLTSSFYKMKKYMGDIYLHILQVLKKRKKILFISLITIIFSIALIGTIIFSYNQYYSYINSKPIISSNCNIEDLVCRVAQTDGTDMRNAPSHNSKIEKRLVENAILEILADDGPPETIDSQTFSWYKVKDSEKVGWVHAQYLQRLK